MTLCRSIHSRNARRWNVYTPIKIGGIAIAIVSAEKDILDASMITILPRRKYSSQKSHTQFLGGNPLLVRVVLEE